MKGKKKILAYILIIVMLAVGITGCMNSNKTVAMINNEKISEPVYRICLWITQKYFESVTPGIWEADSVYGKTPEEYAKDRALSSLKLSIAAKQKAEELGIKLTSDEKKAIKEQAKAYMKENEAFAKAFNIKQKDFREFLTYNTLIDKVIQSLGEGYMPNNEELEEVRNRIRYEKDTATVQHILISNRDKSLGELLPADKLQQEKALAEEVLAKALSGKESFETLVTTYSEDESAVDNGGTYTVTRGELDEALEKVAFETGEVGKVYGKVIETDFGYEIVKVVSRQFLTDEEANNEALELIRTEFASNELSEISEAFKIEKLEAYDQITIMR